MQQLLCFTAIILNVLGDQYGGYHWYRRHGEKLIVLPQAIQALQDDNVTNSNASDLAYYELRIKEGIII